MWDPTPLHFQRSSNGIGRTATDIMKSVAAFTVAMLCADLDGSP